jgi:heme/copper-type cytochrome/quinol oxidase subunit 2
MEENNEPQIEIIDESNLIDWLKIIIMMLILIVTMIVLAVVIFKYGSAIKYNFLKGGLKL